MRVRRWFAVILVASVCGAVGGRSVALGAPSVAAPTAATVAGAPQTALPGGDLQTLPSPRSVRGVSSTSTSWRAVPVVSRAALPADTVAAVILAVTTASAGRSGSVVTRPHGSTTSGVVAASYRVTGGSGTVIVKVGTGGSIDLRASGGSPRVGLKVVAWVPKTASLDVPETAPSAQSVRTSTARTTTLTMTGRAGVPADASPLLVSVGTSSARAARYTLWRADRSRPSAGYAVPVGAASALVVVAPGVGGKVSIRAQAGSPKLTLRVLAWGRGTTTVHGLDRPAALRPVVPGAVRKLLVAGTAGVPTAARGVALALAAPKGSLVSIWRGPTASGAPAYSGRSIGGVLSAWLPVPAGRAVAVKVTGTRSRTAANVSGYADALGAQAVSYTAKAGTRLLASGDVLAQHDGTVDVAASAGSIKVGGHLMVRPATGPAYVGLVTGTAPRPGGGTTVTLQTAQLYDAFSAYDAHFDGAVAGTLSAANKAQARAMADVSGPGPMALSFLSGKFWDCGEGVNVNDLMRIDVSYAGTAYLDFSLAQRSLDFSMRGAVSVTFTLLGGLSVSCSVTGELPFELPLGATGLALKFGGSGELSAEMPETSAGGAFSITGGIRAFAGYGYFDGASTGTQTVHPFGSARSNADGLSLSLKLGVFVKVGVAVPPGEDDVVDASGSLTLGAKFEAGRPDPASDPQHREMRGGQCVDVTLAPYVKIGAEVAVPFFPDVSFDIAEYDGPELDLFKGKCWGYSGTVKTTVNYVISAADQSCTLQYCGKGSHIVRSMTKTLIPQAASFTHFVDAQLGGPYGSPIAQPYTWIYNQADHAAWEANPDPFGLDPPPSLPCSSTTIGAASGVVGWNPDVSAWAWVVDGYQPHTSPWASSGVPDGTVDLTVSVTGEENPCGLSYVEHTSPQPFDAYGAEVANLLGASSILLTLTGNVDGHPGWNWTTTVNLGRADYAR